MTCLRQQLHVGPRAQVVGCQGKGVGELTDEAIILDRHLPRFLSISYGIESTWGVTDDIICMP